MTGLAVSSVLAGLAVSDIDAGTAWYTGLFGREPDARPMPSLAEWHLGDEHVVQVVLDPRRAGGSMLTLRVDDLAVTRDDLAARDVHLRSVDSSSDAVAIAQVEDPDGNSITVVAAS